MQRPERIKVTTALMGLKMCVGIALTLVSPPWNPANIHPKGHHTVAGIMIAMRVLYAIALIVGFVTVWLYWRGVFIARRLVLLASFFYLYEIVHFRNVWQHSHWRGIMAIYGAVLALYLLWYLFTREAKPGSLGLQIRIMPSATGHLL